MPDTFKGLPKQTFGIIALRLSTGLMHF